MQIWWPTRQSTQLLMLILNKMQSSTHGICDIGEQSGVADYVYYRPVQLQILQQLMTTSYDKTFSYNIPDAQ